MAPGRTYISGAAKRKLKLEKENATKKMKGLMVKYIAIKELSENNEVENKILSDTAAQQISTAGDDLTSTVVDENKILPDNAIIQISTPGDDLTSTVEDENKILQDNKVHQNSTDGDDLTSTVEGHSEIKEIVHAFNSDPAMWTEITDKMIEHFIINPPSQNMDMLSKTERMFGSTKRTLTANNFYHVKRNGEKLLRKWLVLSASTKKLFCWVCKLFNGNIISKGQILSGFCDWKHCGARLQEHENSAFHRQSMIVLSKRLTVSQRIDSSLVLQFEDEMKYWISVLERVVAVVKFLALRGLPFFGDDETIGSRHNGNFLGCLEIIAEFDPFLSGHLNKYGNPGTGNISYLSSTTVNEFIDIMTKKVQKQIIDEILCAKYYSIIIDSTPDITHLDQLCFVIRYVVDDQPVERFLKFIPIYNHKSETLEETVLKTLEESGIDILNCRGQSYDNASNMAGKYTGLQARIKSINAMADFVPCAAHSLNLIGVNAVDSCNGAMQFLSFVQQLYNFFSASTHRWQELNEELKKHGDCLTLKSCSGTRWCADANAVKALKKNYLPLSLTLSKLATDPEENASTKTEASGLLKNLKKFETLLNIIIWDTLLQRLNKASLELQKPSLNLTRVISLYKSLIDFVQYVRDNFNLYEELAKEACNNDLDYEVTRKKFKPRSKDLNSLNASEVSMTPREKFKLTVHFAICDSLIAHLHRRKVPYESIQKKFSCLLEIKSSTLREKALYLQNCYPLDLDENFSDELQQFSSLVNDKDSISDIFEKLKSLELEETFPNVESALRIFFTLAVSNCSSERSFSLLKRLKSPMRSSVLQEKLSSLALLCIEGDLTNRLDYKDVIKEFAAIKARKKSF